MTDESIRDLHGVLRAALAQAVRWGWVSRNGASLAELSSRKVSPRKVMSAADVRRVIVAGDEIGPEVGLMLRLSAVTGARRSELAALQWTDVADGVLTVDSAIEIDSRSGRTVLSDAPTKTANQRSITLDAATLAVVAAQQAELEPYGPWMFKVGDERRTQIGSVTGGAWPGRRRVSMLVGGCTTCATGQRRWRSRRGTT